MRDKVLRNGDLGADVIVLEVKIERSIVIRFSIGEFNLCSSNAMSQVHTGSRGDINAVNCQRSIVVSLEIEEVSS